MNIYLGNLTVEQFIERCKLTGMEEEDKIFINEHRQSDADIKSGSDKLHIFDIPFTVITGNQKLAAEFVKRMGKYDFSNSPQLQVAYK